MLFPPEDLRHVFELVIGISANTIRAIEATLRPMSMTYPQFGALLALVEREGVTQRELGEMLQCDRTTVSVICDSLEKREWAERRPDPTDRRVKRIFLTETGRAIAAEAQPLVWEAYGTVRELLSDEEIALVVPPLQRMHEALDHIHKCEGQS